MLGTLTPPVQPQFQDTSNSYLMSQGLHTQQMFDQSLQQGFDTMGLGDNVFTPTKSRRRTNGLKTGAQSITPYEYGGGQVNPYAQGQSDIFYQPSQTAYMPGMPLNFLNYAPVAPYPQKLLPFQKTIHGFFLSDTLREDLQRKGEAALQPLPHTPGSLLPPSVNEYHSLVPLDMSNQKNTQVFGYPSWVYKAFSSEDPNIYALRRIENFRLVNESDIRVIQRWKKVTSANVVTIHNAWTTTKFGDSSIVFVYDYHPLSKTLAEAHFGSAPGYGGSRHNVAESVLWNYIVQLASALKTIHNTGLAARVIDPTKVLLTSKNRIRLNCCGILDVLRPEPSRPLQELQAEDFVMLGRMILSIACNSPLAAQNPKSMEYIGKNYSANFREQIYMLVIGQVKNIDEFAKNIASHTLASLNSSMHYEDSLESELMRELENGRIVRLLSKLGFINERPEFDHDPRWSETGDRYYIKLFRDYVFHSVDENGQPVVDIGHVMTCLNKLDAGVDEKIMLVSRDSLNCFVVTYKDLKRNIESTFQELTKVHGRR
ncbi:hypothetical protein FN846DRAFT_909312 [Sphaerosporella brunnea]|uniref:PAN2-PAN3 deadenylation complex subunit PAN3 n=1 Tax=Sphaerosporella brunnea TaxID=1250544 RepID=A0A5J5ERK8_9PEZI|nr:hypothetical protein FN846DRAFT_909312 [Sphaerosporella brunnea]